MLLDAERAGEGFLHGADVDAEAAEDRDGEGVGHLHDPREQVLRADQRGAEPPGLALREVERALQPWPDGEAVGRAARFVACEIVEDARRGDAELGQHGGRRPGVGIEQGEEDVLGADGG